MDVESHHYLELGGLWPIYGGTVTKPASSEFTYIPQRPYLSLGTLRDQLIYPDSKKQISSIWIQSLKEKEDGKSLEWRDALSGGDKQRLAILCYFGRMYFCCHVRYRENYVRTCYSLGITLLTVSHRPSLWKYHKFILQYDGEGGYCFTELDAEKRLALQEEKQALEQKLLEVPKLLNRLNELEETRLKNDNDVHQH
ncbi:hypothetical protein H4Q26_014734 [Puccinia striiformis f. sp. tritici PST-130]|nr:hypothetical protein H4Q26_014734 [Puccinia striiformis f. sp. tritici PST-130]